MQLQLTPALTLSVLALASSAIATARQYNTIQISDGVGGDAMAQAQAAFPGALDSLSATQFEDVNTEAHCAVLAEAQYLSAQSAAGASSAEGKALGVGITKNKVLKIYSTLQAVESQIKLQGNSTSLAASQADLITKLATNVKLDQANNGATSKSVSFTCP